MPFKIPVLLSLLLLVLLSRSGSAQTLYYDTNGATPGTSTSSTADSTQSVWTTDSTGSSATETYVDGSNIVFSASDGVNVGTGTQNYTFENGGTVANLTVNDGTVTVVAAGTPASSVSINGVASGNLSFDATDGDTIALNNGSNSFTGTVTAEDGGTITVGHLGSLDGNTVDLNTGGTFDIAYFENYNGYSNNIVLGTGGGNFAVTAPVPGSPDDAVYVGTITGGTGLTLTTGDLLEGSGDGSNNVGSITIDSAARLLAINGGIFSNNAAVNVNSGGILDFGFGTSLSNTITLLDGSLVESRAGTTTLKNVLFPGSGTITLGSDDSGGGALIFNTSTITLGGDLNIQIHGHAGQTNSTPVFLDNPITGNGNLTFENAADGTSSTLEVGNNNNANNYTGTTTINNLSVNADSYTSFGSSVVTLNNSTIYLPGGYNSQALVNEFILGTGTNTFNTFQGISAFTGSVVTGAGSDGVLHLLGSNNTINPGAGEVSDYGTLDIDSGRTFLMGPNGLNFIAAGANNNGQGTTVNIATNTTIDFDVPGSYTVNNPFTFASGSGIQLRDDFGEVDVTLTDVTLPTSGSFSAGSDDEGNERGSIKITSNLVLSGDLTLLPADSGGSTVSFIMQGNITGTGNLTVAAGPTGPGTLVLSGANNGYSGNTTISSATLQIASTGSLPSGTVVTEGGSGTSGTLVLGDSTGAADVIIAGLTTFAGSTGNSVVGGSSAVSGLTVNNATSDTYAGTIGGAGTNQNNVAVTKSGAGTLTLSGTNTYTGGTTVAVGKLAVDGSIAGNVAVQVGAELGGHGTIAGTISGAGAVGPGNSPGILTAASVDPSGGTSFNFEFTLAGMPTYGDASASGNDMLHLTGATPFTAALSAGNVINLYFSGVGTYQGGVFVDGADNLTANIADATFNYYIADADGPVSYNGANYELTSGSESVVAADGTFASGSVDGYTEEFTASAVPEPSSASLFVVGALGLLFLARRAARSAI